jgi:predicted Rossmann fold nucleotide-binding protein DprA/Smf involved in DNA uptake
MNEMGIVRVEPFASLYPASLIRALGRRTPGSVYLMGKQDLAALTTLGLLCSVRCPGEVIMKTYDLVRELRREAIPVLGGFHSPMERECLSLLLGGSQPVVICLGRCLEGMRIPGLWKQPLADGRLLILSCFDERHRRLTKETAACRNRYVSILADQVLVAHAAPGSRTERLCQKVLDSGKTVWTPLCQQNRHLLSLGAQPLTLETLPELRSLSAGPGLNGEREDDLFGGSAGTLRSV